MLQAVETDGFAKWLGALRDTQGKVRILKQVQRVQVAEQYVGDWKPVGNGVVELRLHFGPGYRLYMSIRGKKVLLLLVGGDKSSQAKDIEAAARLLGEWEQAEEEAGEDAGNGEVSGV